MGGKWRRQGGGDGRRHAADGGVPSPARSDGVEMHTSSGEGADQAVVGRAPVAAVGAAGWVDNGGGKVAAMGGGTPPTTGPFAPRPDSVGTHMSVVVGADHLVVVGTLVCGGGVVGWSVDGGGEVVATGGGAPSA